MIADPILAEANWWTKTLAFNKGKGFLNIKVYRA
jgi:hypothetical protein